jgi:hypothetical protein
MDDTEKTIIQSIRLDSVTRMSLADVSIMEKNDALTIGDPYTKMDKNAISRERFCTSVRLSLAFNSDKIQRINSSQSSFQICVSLSV